MSCTTKVCSRAAAAFRSAININYSALLLLLPLLYLPLCVVAAAAAHQAQHHKELREVFDLFDHVRQQVVNPREVQ